MPANFAIAQNYEALDTIWVVLHLIFVNDKHFTGAILRVFPFSYTVQGVISQTKSYMRTYLICKALKNTKFTINICIFELDENLHKKSEIFPKRV